MCNYCSILAGDSYRMNGMMDEGMPVIVSYAFPTQPMLANDELAADRKLIDAVREATAHFEETAGVRFTEVGPHHDAMVEIIYNHDHSGVSYGTYPLVHEGVTSTNGTLAMTSLFTSFAKGGFGYEYLLHEFGHMLGLKHPFAGAKRLPAHLDNTDNTVMSYTTISGPKASLQSLDVAALTALYGDASALERVAVAFKGSPLEVLGTHAADVLVGINDANLIRASNGADVVHGRDAADMLYGNRGPDRLAGHGGNDMIFGGVGNDNLLGGTGADILRGGRGSDVVRGGAGADKLFGDGGHDTLIGDNGADTMVGRTGGDVFVLSEALAGDVIADFDIAEGDRIDVGALGLTRAEALASLTKAGNHALFHHDGGFATLYGFDPNDASEGLFIV